MTTANQDNGRTLKVLSTEELLHVTGGTDDPAKPIGDPGDVGPDLDVSPQWMRR